MQIKPLPTIPICKGVKPCWPAGGIYAHPALPFDALATVMWCWHSCYLVVAQWPLGGIHAHQALPCEALATVMCWWHSGLQVAPLPSHLLQLPLSSLPNLPSNLLLPPASPEISFPLCLKSPQRSFIWILRSLSPVAAPSFLSLKPPI